METGPKIFNVDNSRYNPSTLDKCWLCPYIIATGLLIFFKNEGLGVNP